MGLLGIFDLRFEFKSGGVAMPTRYRPNVAGILRDDKGKILVCERIRRADSWQFPQGGIDEGEKALAALLREMEEEIGLSKNLYSVGESRSGYRYEFEKGRNKYGFDGQEQTYFLCDFHGKSEDICIETKHPEFQNTQWIKPKDFNLKWVPKFKRAVYKKVLNDFFDV
jgi:putative (di)nucleoside polyphosphate hydrolase